MDEAAKRSQECYNLPGIRVFWKKYKALAVNVNANHHHHHHHHHHHSNHSKEEKKHVSFDESIKPTTNLKHDLPSSKGQGQGQGQGQDGIMDRKEDVNKKVRRHNRNRGHSISGKGRGGGVEDLNNTTTSNYDHHQHHYSTSCFKTIILFKKKQRISVSSEPEQEAEQEDHHPNTKVKLNQNQNQKIPSRTRSLDSTFSKTNNKTAGRSQSINYRSTNNESTNIQRTTSDAAGYWKSGSFKNNNASFARRGALNVSRSGPIIMFSNSSGLLKPPTVEHPLECTLEELCHGCLKDITVSTDVYTTNGRILEQDKSFKVEVKPGWKAGTKITFQGSESSSNGGGESCGDVIFIINEKHHPLFKRNEDNLELEIEIPLSDALTGCNLNIPSINTNNNNISLSLDDIVVYPGYQRVIVGEGMPNKDNPHQRGDLIVNFLVQFPTTLTQQQRSQIFTLLTAT